MVSRAANNIIRAEQDARAAAAAAKRNLLPATVQAVHNGDTDLARLAGSTPGQPLYTVRAVGRRFQEFDIFPVASAIPVQVGHRVFVSFLDGDLSRGAWITGLTHPPVPQMQADTVDVMPFGTYAGTTQAPTLPGTAYRLFEVEDAFIATAASMRFNFSLSLPGHQGSARGGPDRPDPGPRPPDPRGWHRGQHQRWAGRGSDPVAG